MDFIVGHVLLVYFVRKLILIGDFGANNNLHTESHLVKNGVEFFPFFFINWKTYVVPWSSLWPILICPSTSCSFGIETETSGLEACQLGP